MPATKINQPVGVYLTKPLLRTAGGSASMRVVTDPDTGKAPLVGNPRTKALDIPSIAIPTKPGDEED